jgi:hypothetical protein
MMSLDGFPKEPSNIWTVNIVFPHPIQMINTNITITTGGMVDNSAVKEIAENVWGRVTAERMGSVVGDDFIMRMQINQFKSIMKEELLKYFEEYF